MASALARHRGRACRSPDVNYRIAGFRKYGICCLAAAVAASAAWWLTPWLVLPAVILVFYAVEAQSVFVFPLLADFGARGRRAMPALLRRAGGVPSVMCVVMPLATKMLFGGFFGGGFRRSWFQGCAAVAIWYDDLGESSEPRPPIFDIGARCALSVRRIKLDGARTKGPRLLYASDLHFGAWAARDVLPDLVKIITRERPDAVLLGGDLVDTVRGLNRLSEAVATLSRLAPVLAVPGNHDALVGVDRVRDAVTSAGGIWLSDGSKKVGDICIDGVPQSCSDEDRAYRILCTHDPKSFELARRADYDLVLAGHLHGGQIVIFRRGGREYPAAWIWRWNGPHFQEGTTTMIVSRGCAGTFPIRFRCPRDVLLCDFV